MFLSDDINSFIWLIFAGVCIASFYAYYTKRFLGGLVRKLVSLKIHEESGAKSLTELGYNRFTSLFLRMGLKPGTPLRRYVSAVFPEEKNFSDDLLINNENKKEQKYFIPVENCDIALTRYDEKGTSLLSVIITVVAFFVAALLATVILPIFLGNPDGNANTNDASINENFSQIDRETIKDSSVSSENNASQTNASQSSESQDTDEEFSMLTPTISVDNAN